MNKPCRMIVHGIVLFLLVRSSVQVLKEFDDTILFRLDWPGPSGNLERTKDSGSILISMTTSKQEKYTCVLPNIYAEEKDSDTEFTTESALELLQPLFIFQESCTYRVEYYWTYELCHGKYIRQYHEEKEAGKAATLQEFLLGKYTLKQYREAVAAEKTDFAKNGRKKNIPKRKIEGQLIPYLELNMTDGTLCDINGKPRMATIVYVCYPENRHEIHYIKETSTCEYEIIVLTEYLCQHPDYKLKEAPMNQIQCHPQNTLESKPKDLMNLEMESRNMNLPDYIKSESTPHDAPTSEKMPEQPKMRVMPVKRPPPPSMDDNLIVQFLNGQYCLYGGAGWWKYEFCYGSRVEQYHKEGDKKVASIFLGKWNEKKHLDWIEKNSHKRPKKGPNRKQIWHFYSDGDICDITGLPRQVEVKLKCKDSSDHPSAVSLYLLEPKTCEYILGLESPILCPLVEAADDDGLLSLQEDPERVTDQL